MPALPAGYEPTQSTRFARERSIVTDFAEDGSVRFVDFNTTNFANFRLVFEGLSVAERETLITFLDTNATNDVDIDINSVTYRGKLIDSPAWTPTNGLYAVSIAYRAAPL